MDYGNWIALLAIIANLIISIINRRKAHPKDERAQFDKIPLTRVGGFGKKFPDHQAKAYSNFNLKCRKMLRNRKLL